MTFTLRFKLKPIVLALAALASPCSNAFIAVTPPDVKVGVADSFNGGSGLWNYTYTLTNNSTCFGNCSDTILGKSILGYVLAIKEYSIPYFSDAGVANIVSPDGWGYTIDPTDKFNLGTGAQALVWTALTEPAYIDVGDTLSGFGYTASYSGGKGPFSSTLGNGTIFLGDPAIPLSPNAVTAGIEPIPTAPVPIPGVTIPFALAAASLYRFARRAPTAAA